PTHQPSHTPPVPHTTPRPTHHPSHTPPVPHST
ncbi:uncharacterized protein LOC131934905, partial [Physella acuta]